MTTPTAVTACAACHAPLTPGAHYCHRCGRAVGGGGRHERTAWGLAWTIVVLFVVFVVYYVNRGEAPAPVGPDMANAGNLTAAQSAGQPPDISQMSPEERFLRLHDRVMSAAGSGDSGTVAQFAPMALSAYEMVPAPTVDIRYHAAALFTQAGDYRRALALADTIVAEAPENLLADLIRVEVAQARGDATARQRASRAFLEHYDRQMSLRRPEYGEHQAMLDDLRRQLQRQ